MKKIYSKTSAACAKYSKRRRQLRGLGVASQRRQLMAEPLESRSLLAGDLYNAAVPTDVNGDGTTSPLDALFIINELDAQGARSLEAGVAPQIAGYYDVNNDNYLTPLDALLVLNELNGEGEVGDLVQIRVQPTDTSGNPISTIGVNQDFQLRAYVKDLTARTNGGVFAAYVDVTYNAAQVSVAGSIVHSSSYGNAKAGNTDTAGLIDEAGSTDGLTPLGPDELLLFTVPMHSTSAGTVTFAPNAADNLPSHEVLVFGTPAGEANGVVAPDRIAFVNATLQVGEVVTPTAVNDAYNVVTNENLVVSAGQGVLVNDTYTGTGTLTAAIVAQPTHGTLTLTANGAFSYAPTADFVGTDTFTYRASANGVDSNTATVTLTVARLNTAPVGVSDTYSVNEDATLTSTISVLSNDTDAEGDTLTASLVTNPSHGTLTLQPSGQFVYVPAANYNGPDSFVYKASDGDLQSANTTVSITVRPVNDAPSAVNDAYSIASGQTLTVAAADGVLKNDTDVDGSTLTAAVVSNPAHGTLTLNANGGFTYVSSAGYSGIDTFTYSANDGTTSSAVASVTINVTSGEQTQVRVRLATTALDGTPITSIAAGGSFLLRGYVEDVSELPQDGIFAAYLDVDYTSALVGVNGAISYGPSYPNQHSGSTATAGVIDEVGAFDGLDPLGAGEFLLFSVPMIANQGGTAQFTSNPADLRPAHDILMYNVNTSVVDSAVEYGSTSLTITTGQPPVANNDNYNTNEDTALTLNAANGVLKNDTDPQGDSLTAQLVANAAHGTVVLNADGSFTYTPSLNYHGTDTFTYRASDGAATSAAATVTINVASIDDAPVAVSDTYQISSSGPFVVGAITGVLANDTDVDGDSLSASLVDTAGHGTLTLNGDGSFTYTPAAGFVGVDQFTYRAVANGKSSAIATVTLNVGDLTPSTVSGYVYTDTDNDGVLDDVEARFGGVEITLKGTDLLGRSVSRSTRTAANGSYAFADVLAGNYTVTEFQPMFLVDGKDTHNGELSLRNDRFAIKLGAGVVDGGYNFGERGLMPQFILNPMFFASRTSHGMLAALDGDGDLSWYCLDNGWKSLATVDASLNTSTGTADVTVTTATGASDNVSVLLNGNRNARVTGDQAGGYLLKLTGDPGDFGLSPVQSGTSVRLSADAVDAAIDFDFDSEVV